MGQLEQLEDKHKLMREFERNLLTMKPEQKWRYVADLVLRRNPKAKFEHDEIIKSIHKIREAQANKTAASRGGSMRFGLRMPTTILEAIELTDPKVGVIINGKDLRAQNRLVRQLMKTFREYRIPREI